jgi:hypothetical protein
MTEDLKQLRRYVVTANKIMKPTLQLNYASQQLAKEDKKKQHFIQRN